ncbi:replication factor A protein 2 [Mortierella polycephala]|uniref:Replication factor A protein 2 n=1 Tax=Mortierella polycephala TaxID=41804 RepID=A0A9P6QIW0_9FUNG|nr:replication factor A protein 2 [Mortierella polycephala]
MSNFNKQYNTSGQGYIPDSFSSEGGAVKKIANHTLRPVTIKQLLQVAQTQSDGDFKIDDRDLGQITFIATVRGINRQSTQHTYTVEDGTGTIEAKKFPTDDDENAEANPVLFSVNLHTIRPVEDSNELIHHLAEVMYVHCALTRPKINAMNADSNSAMGGAHMNYNSNFSSHSMAAAGSAPAASRSLTSKDIPEQIAQMIQGHPGKASGMGVPRREIQARFASVLGNAESVNAMINSMIAEGLLYTTDDDDHVCTAF